MVIIILEQYLKSTYLFDEIRYIHYIAIELY